MTEGYPLEVLTPWLDAVRASGVGIFLLAAGCLGCAAEAGWIRHRLAALQDHRTARRWRVLLVGWLALAAAYAWRLDVLLAGSLRWWAKQDGWYGQRQGAQLAVMALTCLLAAFAAWPMLRAGRRVEQAFVLACAAVVLLLGFRVGSLHVVDALLAQSIAGLSAGRLLEAGLIGIAFGCGLHQLSRY